jgi:glycosyltransferase involved in cell wall biosynthesis
VADDSGCGEVIRLTGGGRVVPHGDPEILRHAIDDILEHHTNWRNAAAAAAQRVRTLYATGAVCAQLETVYHELTAGRACAA